MSLLSYYTFAQSNVSNDTYFTKYPLLDSLLANENRYLVDILDMCPNSQLS